MVKASVVTVDGSRRRLKTGCGSFIVTAKASVVRFYDQAEMDMWCNSGKYRVDGKLSEIPNEVITSPEYDKAIEAKEAVVSKPVEVIDYTELFTPDKAEDVVTPRVEDMVLPAVEDIVTPYVDTHEGEDVVVESIYKEVTRTSNDVITSPEYEAAVEKPKAKREIFKCKADDCNRLRKKTNDYCVKCMKDKGIV